MKILSYHPIEKSPILILVDKIRAYFHGLDRSTRIMIFTAILIILSTPFIVANRQIFSPRAAVGEQPTLESLGVIIDATAFPSTNIWREGNILYGEAADLTLTGDKGPFVAYDLNTRKVLYSGNTDIHRDLRNIMVDKAGNAYFSVNLDVNAKDGNQLAKYNRATNTVSVLSHILPNFLRASTRETTSGWIYGATGQNSPTDLFRFNPTQNIFEKLGPSWDYTTVTVLDPTERYFYYLPGAHGGCWEWGCPVLQYDTQTKSHKVIAFLNNVYESKYGYRLGGTYGMDIDKEGKRLFISMNTQKIGTDPTGGFGSPALFVVNIPASETPQVVPPKIRFEDVASKVGLNGPLTNSYIHSASWGDINNDGWIDLFAGTFVEGTTQVADKLLLNKNGAFQDSGQASISIKGRGAGSVFADFDNDNDLDLYISNNKIVGQTGAVVEPSHILRNDNGNFVDVTSTSGISAQTSNGRQVGVLDYNNDGRLDLFVVADSLRGSGNTVLLRNKGNFVFEDVTAAAGLPTDVKGLGLAISDVTGDGWPDIFVAGGTASNVNTNHMFIAKGDGTYRRLATGVFDWSSFVKGSEDWVSGASFGDLNRDGRLDLLVGHHFGTSVDTSDGASLRVYMNRGNDPSNNPIFEDITSKLGLPKVDQKSPHVEIQDFDNDGWMDLYTSVRIDDGNGFAPLIFTHTGLSGGDPTFAKPAITNPHYFAGGPVADYNRDGKLDVFFPEWRSSLGTPVPSMLMQNTGAPGNWLQIKVDVAGNSMGVGAKVKIYKDGMSGNSAGLLGFTEISPAYGFSSSQPAIAHFGLGSETKVDVVVEMPFKGTVYTKNAVPVNRLVVMPNGAVETPAHMGLEKILTSDTDPGFLQKPTGITFPTAATIATAVPTVDFALYPHPSYAATLWSVWGGGLFASNNRFYSSIGDHKTTDGNSYMYEYDPITKKVKLVGDVQTAVNHVAGNYGHGKIHAQIVEGNDGYIYTTSYRGSTVVTLSNNYRGGVLLRYPINTVAAGTTIGPTSTPTPSGNPTPTNTPTPTPSAGTNSIAFAGCGPAAGSADGYRRVVQSRNLKQLLWKVSPDESQGRGVTGGSWTGGSPQWKEYTYDTQGGFIDKLANSADVYWSATNRRFLAFYSSLGKPPATSAWLLVCESPNSTRSSSAIAVDIKNAVNNLRSKLNALSIPVYVSPWISFNPTTLCGNVDTSAAVTQFLNNPGTSNVLSGPILGPLTLQTSSSPVFTAAPNLCHPSDDTNAGITITPSTQHPNGKDDIVGLQLVNFFNGSSPTVTPTRTPTPTPTGAVTPTSTPSPTSEPSPTPGIGNPSDINRNGCVDILDFSLWLTAFQTGVAVPGSKPDINSDGRYDLLDFNEWFITMRNGVNQCL